MNTEYQRQTIQRLKEITDMILTELDENSPYHYRKHLDNIDDQVSNYIRYKKREEYYNHELEKVFAFDPFQVEQYNRCIVLKHDPFLPKKLRKEIFSFFENRFARRIRIHERETKKFQQRFLKKKMEGRIWEWQEYVRDKVHIAYKKAGWDDKGSESKIIDLLKAIETYLSELD